MLGCETEEEFVESVVMPNGLLSASENSGLYPHPRLPRHIKRLGETSRGKRLGELPVRSESRFHVLSHR